MESVISRFPPDIDPPVHALPDRTFGTAAAIRGSQSVQELHDAIRDLAADLSYTAFGTFEVASDGENHVLRMISGETSLDWRTHYVAQRLFRADPRVRFARDLSRPFFISELDPLDLRPGEVEFLRGAAAFGLHESFIYPYRTFRDRAFAVVMAGPGRRITDPIRTATESVAASFLHASLRLESLRLKPEEKPILNERQLECLEFVRLGKSSSVIGELLNLSPRTIDAHLAAASVKLGVTTRVQAASKALEIGLLPYRKA